MKDDKKRHIVRDLIIPLLALLSILLVFVNVKHIPFDFNEKNSILLRYVVKFIMTIGIPLALIHLLYKDKRDFGIYFPKFSDSFKLSIRAYAIGGPAGITFLLIGLLGWGFADRAGSLSLTLVYLVVFFLVPRVTAKLPTRTAIVVPNKGILSFVLMGLATVMIAYFTYDDVPIISKVLYYIFIVGLGEELLFRGYLQSSFNRFFWKVLSDWQRQIRLGLTPFGITIWHTARLGSCTSIMALGIIYFCYRVDFRVYQGKRRFDPKCDITTRHV